MRGDFLPHSHQAAAAAPEGFFEELTRSALYGGVQSPLSGLAQLTDHTTAAVAGVFNCEGTNLLPRVQFMDAPAEAKFGTGSWYAQQFGGALGVAGDFFLLHKAQGLGTAGRCEATAMQSFGCLAKLEARHAAISGAIYGGVFVPVDTADGNFWTGRLRNSAVQSATFATLSSSAVGLTGFGATMAKETPILSSLLKNEIAVGALSGMPAGLVNANAESILHGKGLASTQEVALSMYSFAVVGGTLQAANKLVGHAFAGGKETDAGKSPNEISQSKPWLEPQRAFPEIAVEQALKPPTPTEPPTTMFSRIRKLIGLNELPPAAPGERPQESAQVLGIKLPAMTADQIALSEATVLEAKRDGRGSMGLEKYLAKVQLPDGGEQNAMIRMFPRGWGSTSRFRHEQAAYHMNSKIGFENGFPTTALRTFERNGEPVRAWIQDASGGTFGDRMRALAKERYGQTSDAAVSRMVKEDPQLHLQVEQAFVERLIYADTDPSAFNMVLTPDRRVQNIDLDMSFHGSPTPEVTSSPAYGINHQLLEDFSGQPLSTSTLSKVSSFVRRYNNESGKAALIELGLRPSEVSAMLSRAQWFARNGIFPETKTLSL